MILIPRNYFTTRNEFTNKQQFYYHLKILLLSNDFTTT